MRNSLAALLVAAMTAGLLAPAFSSVPAHAQTMAQAESPDDDGKTLEEAERLARETAKRLMETLRLMLEYIPQYEMPEITEDGDIIIRRKHPEPEPEPENGDSSRT
jgi:hypothetical protein